MVGDCVDLICAVLLVGLEVIDFVSNDLLVVEVRGLVCFATGFACVTTGLDGSDVEK